MSQFVKNDPRINRKGRPKKAAALTEILRKELNRKGTDNISRKTKLIQAIIEKAIAGDIVAIKYIFDRIDGKPVETVELPIELPGMSGIEIQKSELIAFLDERRSIPVPEDAEIVKEKMLLRLTTTTKKMYSGDDEK